MWIVHCCVIQWFLYCQCLCSLVCHAWLTSVSDRTKNCETFENNHVLLYSEARNRFLWQDQNRRADKPLIFRYSPLGAFSDWKPFRWAQGRSTGVRGGWNDGTVVSPLLFTSCSFKFVSVLLGNVSMWFSPETVVCSWIQVYFTGYPYAALQSMMCP